MKEEINMSWDDLVFDHRNKSYGAYEIRQRYSGNTLKGLLIAMGIAALVLAFPAIARWLKSEEVEEKTEQRTIKYTELAPPPPIDKNVPPPPKLDVPPPVKTVIKFLPPKVTEKEVEEKEEMPTIEEIKKTDTGAETQVGDGEVVFTEPVEEVAKGDGVDENAVFTVVEQMPEFMGGMEAMMKYIGKNLRYPAAARRMGVEGKVFVSFVVDTDGKIAEVQVVRGISTDCDQEGMRVIKSMPPWKPGKQRGRPVRVRFTLPINFKLAQ
jgi:protein TonB